MDICKVLNAVMSLKHISPGDVFHDEKFSMKMHDENARDEKIERMSITVANHQ